MNGLSVKKNTTQGKQNKKIVSNRKNQNKTKKKQNKKTHKAKTTK